MPKNSLTAYQACFVVNDVGSAVEFCTTQLGWGPFQHFNIPSHNARYRQWQGDKLTEVALGMAGRAQIELIHVHSGEDAIQQYQSRMGSGLQHLGILCQSTDEALAHVGALGAVLNDRNQYGDITFSFIDVPQGPAMLELLERGAQGLPNAQADTAHESTIGRTTHSVNARLLLDRATLVTSDIESSAVFFAKSFLHCEYTITEDTLSYSAPTKQRPAAQHTNVHALRCLIPAGVLDIELIQLLNGGSDIYSNQLKRAARHGGHGLIHVGGYPAQALEFTATPRFDGNWLVSGESFSVYTGPDDLASIQIRNPA